MERSKQPAEVSLFRFGGLGELAQARRANNAAIVFGDTFAAEGLSTLRTARGRLTFGVEQAAGVNYWEHGLE